MKNASLFTSEEREVPVYNVEDISTRPQDVNYATPLNSLSLNWTEKQLPERIRTKHVHRLHPYLGKYIPQLVEIFIRKYFSSEMTVLDPFSGSGTTLVQANEANIHSVGCDISAFNILISSVKTTVYNIDILKKELGDILEKTAHFTGQDSCSIPLFDTDKKGSLKTINKSTNDYLQNWFAPQSMEELLTYRQLLPNYEYAEFMKLILSRSARSARLTTHFDLDFPKRPTTEPYYCYKHIKICSPTQTAFKFLSRYSQDGLRRVEEFSHLRTNANIRLIHGDSREVDFPYVDGVITSPPYVGLIDYHEQHRYAFELLAIEDNRQDEIGSASNGQSITARKTYLKDMKAVFANVIKSIKSGSKIIVVAADKFDLYSEILNHSEIVHDATLERHVNRRTGRRSGKFFESIFIYTKR